MKPGRELDAFVAEKVMRIAPTKVWIATSDGGRSAAVIQDVLNGPFYSKEDVQVWIQEHAGYELGYWNRWPPYSTDIAAAWRVIEKLEADGWPVSINRQPDGWEAIFWDECDDRNQATKETLPLAICLASLKAVGQEGA